MSEIINEEVINCDDFKEIFDAELFKTSEKHNLLSAIKNFIVFIKKI